MIDRADRFSLGPEEILINVSLVETRIALVSSGKLIELILASPPGEPESALLGGIFLGQVSKIVKGVDAAFVTIAPEVTGFLATSDAQVLAEQKGQADHQEQVPIDACLCEGEHVVVQVIKEPLKDKGPRLSAAITLPGRYIVLAPTQPRIAVSRRIEDETERRRLTELAETLSGRIQNEFGFKPGFIVRTAALGRHEAALAQDAEHLAALWQDVTASASLATPPVRLDAPVDALDRVLRDFVLPATQRIVIDDRATFNRLCVLAETAMPDLQDKLVFYDETANAFDLYELDGQIDLALCPRADLPSGAWITIETTEALTAIDVNSGSYAHKSGLDFTARHANLEAVPEIAQQIRLREIGGLIVIDFIKMQNASHMAEVSEALRTALAADPAPHQVADMSVFGLVELTRKRVRDSLVDRLTEPTGQAARQPTRQHAAARLFRQIEREARLAPGLAIDVQLGSDLACWLDGPGDGAYTKLRDRLGVNVTLHVQDDWPRDRYDVAVPRN